MLIAFKCSGAEGIFQKYRLKLSSVSAWFFRCIMQSRRPVSEYSSSALLTSCSLRIHYPRRHPPQRLWQPVPVRKVWASQLSHTPSPSASTYPAQRLFAPQLSHTPSPSTSTYPVNECGQTVQPAVCRLCPQANALVASRQSRRKEIKMLANIFFM